MLKLPEVNATQILMPVLSHRFIVRFYVGSEELPLLTKQTRKIEYDLSTKQAKIEIEIPAVGRAIEKQLAHFVENSGKSCIVVEYPSYTDMTRIDHSIRFDAPRFTKCCVNHDYANASTPLIADLVFDFDKINVSATIDNKEQIV